METEYGRDRAMTRFFTRRVVAAVAAVALVVGVIAGTALAYIAGALGGGGQPTAVVRRADLTLSAAGSLGYDGQYTIDAPAGTSALRLDQARQAVTEDQQALAGDEQAESDAASAVGGNAAAEVAARTASVRAQNRVLNDQARLQAAQATLAALQPTAVSPGTVYTWLPGAGDVIRQNQPVYAASDQPVLLLYGPEPAYRAFYPGMSGGPDVHQLNQDLVTLRFAGKDLARSSQYSAQTAAAVRRWQSSQDLPATGEIPLGGVVFEPGPIRVTSVSAAVGAPVGDAGDGNGTVLKATGTVPVVTVNLGPELKPGEAVSVTTPGGGLSTGGTVKSVAGQKATIVMDRPPPPAAVAEQAPVSVSVNSRTARHVLAVPVNALLPLPGGGQGLDVVTGDGSIRLTEVSPGLRAGAQVEVKGPGITDGTSVAVPAAGLRL